MRTRSPLREGLKPLVANPKQGQMANYPLPDPGECGKELRSRENDRQPEADHIGRAWVDHTWDTGTCVVKARRFPCQPHQEE